MKSMAGILIKEKRIQKDWSQESLCHGICSISYLSKLENGNIQVNEEIVDALFQRLGIDRLNDQDLEKINQFYQDAFHPIYDVINVHFSKEELEMMENSFNCLDSLLIQFYQSQCDSKESILYEKIKNYTSFMNERQLKLFDQLSFVTHHMDENIFLKKYQSSDSYLIVALARFNQGSIASAIYYWTKAYGQACQEANVKNMAMAQMGLGNMYCSLHEEELMKQCYQKVEKMISISDIDIQKEDLLYNMATLYIEQNQPEKALSMLQSVISSAQQNLQLVYHKIALCYEMLGQKEKAKESIHKGLETSSEYDFLLEIVLYRLEHSNYIQDKEYEDLIRNGLAFCENHLPYGFLLNMHTLLLEVLEGQRRYKEAYGLLKEIFIKNHRK